MIQSYVAFRHRAYISAYLCEKVIAAAGPTAAVARHGWPCLTRCAIGSVDSILCPALSIQYLVASIQYACLLGSNALNYKFAERYAGARCLNAR
jgi:hypothetical protein